MNAMKPRISRVMDELIIVERRKIFSAPRSFQSLMERE
ncbi:MAG: hypothetical protein A4E74_02473 [Syntrophus sp. PtaB.Bin075]|nr:MAG: hypothetical protein A4E74_02473 [Syntrophus sp. PtaB.Bin075]